MGVQVLRSLRTWVGILFIDVYVGFEDSFRVWRRLGNSTWKGNRNHATVGSLLLYRDDDFLTLAPLIIIEEHILHRSEHTLVFIRGRSGPL